ncbi:hypothetical protein Aperf_G00000017604 [Anoplocephala perfoliata]
MATTAQSSLQFDSSLFQTSHSTEFAKPENVNGGPSFVPLVDVGTATMRLSNAHTQTDVNVAPNYVCPSIPVPAAQQTDFCYYNNPQQEQMTRDSFTVTTPPQMSVGDSSPPPTFLPDMSHTSTYMSPGHSIELQYPETNSNGTMTAYCDQPLHPQQHAFQQTTAIPTTSVAAATCAPSTLYLPSGSADSIACYGVFDGTNSSTYNNEWRGMRRPDGQSLNSVAVETTFDLANFDASSSGNCYWPSADSFAHMQTQTNGEAASLEDWFSTDVQTQTSTTRTGSVVSRLQQSGWTDNGACVGVNTEMLMTPKHEGNSL